MRAWGTTAAEVARTLPCAALLPDAALVYDRAITIAAPREVVFRWLCQLRAAPYSYDWIDNLGRRSPRTLTPGLEHLAAGQRYLQIYRIASVTPDAQITAANRRSSITYALDGDTRLHVRMRVALPRWTGALLGPGDLVMMRKQLRTLKALAEADAGAGPASARAASSP